MLVLILLFLALFTVATVEAFNASAPFGGNRGPINARDVTSITLIGLGMFAPPFLATVLAVFLTLGAIRGDAERGLLVALSLLGTVFLSAAANGIAIFMLYGAGLGSGLPATIGTAVGAHTVQTIAHDLAIALPFEALYQAGLHAIGSNQSGLTGGARQPRPVRLLARRRLRP